MKIGFIGLGNMGAPMVENLVKGGYEVMCYDAFETAVERGVKAGAKALPTSRAVGEECETVITMVPNYPNVKAILEGENGLLAGMKPGSIHIDMSSIPPKYAKEFSQLEKEKGIINFDAPVTGGVGGAQKATLTILVGGDKDYYEKILPILQVMGKNITYFGDSGTGQVAKIANQIMVATQIVAVTEAWTLAVKAGADPQILCNALSSGAGSCLAMTNILPNKILKGDREPGFAVDLMYKDISIAMDTSRDLKVPLNLTSVAMETFESARAMGLGKKDYSSIVEILENITGVHLDK